MSIFSRFFGKKDDAPDDKGRLIANEAIENPIGLQVLLKGTPQCDTKKTLAALVAQIGIKNPRCEFDAEMVARGTPIGLVGWGKHVVKVIGFNVPMPESAVENCVAPSHYSQEVKEQVRAHDSHLLLWYAGHDFDVLEQYVALSVAAAALAGDQGLAVLNEAAVTSLPASIFDEPEMRHNMIELMRSFPPMMLFCGFVKGDVEGVDGVWMRTYGAHLFHLPDFAALAEGHHEGGRYCDIFQNLFVYLRESGNQILPGNTMQIGEEEFLRCREPSADEPFLVGESELLVLEIITKDQINSR